MFMKYTAVALVVLASVGTVLAAEPPSEHLSPDAMAAMATTYVQALLSHDGSALKLTPDVRRTENGLVNANGENEVRASFAETKMVTGTRNLHLVADEKRQAVTAFFLVDVSLSGSAQTETKAGDKAYKVAVSVPGGDYTVHEAEEFRFSKGAIHEIEIIANVQKGRGGTTGWPDRVLP